MLNLENFIQKIPKAELHLHIEGTLEPELMLTIARRNGITVKYQTVEELRQAYNFNNLQEFLDIYYQGANVLRNEDDFFDMTWAYLLKAKEQNVVHAEIFFDPQTHTGRGIKFETVIRGISRALKDGKEKLDIGSCLIMCFLRHLDEEDAEKTLDVALDYKKLIVAVGLDSSEVGHPPAKFERVFKRSLQAGFLTVAHAGEEGPAEYVRQAIDLLKVSRIDHGNHSLDDDQLVQELVEKQIPLTVCPLSNLKLKVVDELKNHPLRRMMEKGLLVTVNSDDPAYFGGYVNENYLAVASALNLPKQEITQLAKNSIEASFINQPAKQVIIKKIDEFCIRNQ